MTTVLLHNYISPTAGTITLYRATLGLLTEYQLIIKEPGRSPTIRCHQELDAALRDFLLTVVGEVSCSGSEALAHEFEDGPIPRFAQDSPLVELQEMRLFQGIPVPQEPSWDYGQEDLRAS